MWYKDFATYCTKESPDFMRTDGHYLRVMEDAAGKFICSHQIAVQAGSVSAQLGLTGLVVVRGPVSANEDIRRSLVLATGNVTVGAGIYFSVIICDGDVLIPKTVQMSLVIARGNIVVKGDALSSTLIAGGTVKVTKLPPVGPIVLADDTPLARIQYKLAIRQMELDRVVIKEKEANPLGLHHLLRVVACRPESESRQRRGHPYFSRGRQARRHSRAEGW